MHLSTEDAASVETVLGTLEEQASKLDAASKIAGVWREWATMITTARELNARPPSTSEG